jgi:FkbM family methyltransferase
MTATNPLEEAAAALANKDLARAEAISNEILKHQPTHPEALHLLSTALAAQGRVAEALARYQSVVQQLQHQVSLSHLNFGFHVLQCLGFRPKGILDIGAFEGAFALTAQYFFPQAPILMFEAQPGMEVHLKAIARQVPHMEYRIQLLGAERRQDVPFHHVNAAVHSSGSSLYDEQTSYPRQTIRLSMRTLDDVMAEFQGREFDMLKIDVQGADLDVLRGGLRTLAGIEVLVIELSVLEYNKGAPLMAEVMAWLSGQGFAPFDLFPVSRVPPVGALLQIDAIFLRRESGLWPKPPFY